MFVYHNMEGSCAEQTSCFRKLITPELFVETWCLNKLRDTNKLVPRWDHDCITQFIHERENSCKELSLLQSVMTNNFKIYFSKLDSLRPNGIFCH